MRTYLIGVFFCMAACQREPRHVPAPPAPTIPNQMTEAEKARGAEACETYQRKVCACASTHAVRAEPLTSAGQALQEACKTAHSLVEALATTSAVIGQGGVEVPVAQRTQMAARDLVKQCFESLAQLPTMGCAD